MSSIHDLNPDPEVNLFKITLTNGTIFRITPMQTVTWRGNTWEFLPITIADLAQSSDGKAVRPKLSFANPSGMFTSAISNGSLELAKVIHYKVLKPDLDANLNIYIEAVWWVGRIASVGKHLIVTELRDVFDGAKFILPGRGFYPPEFSHVSL